MRWTLQQENSRTWKASELIDEMGFDDAALKPCRPMTDNNE
jgi:hypothetical protein